MPLFKTPEDSINPDRGQNLYIFHCVFIIALAQDYVVCLNASLDAKPKPDDIDDRLPSPDDLILLLLFAVQDSQHQHVSRPV
jgi:hypothetical protein